MYFAALRIRLCEVVSRAYGYNGAFSLLGLVMFAKFYHLYIVRCKEYRILYLLLYTIYAFIMKL